MKEYIEREAISKAYMDLCLAKSKLAKSRKGATFFQSDLLPETEPTTKELFRLAMAMPTADVAEVRHGRWVNPHWRNSDFACNCSACGVEAIHREYRWHERGIYPICPNCGARMYKEADHEVSEP